MDYPLLKKREDLQERNKKWPYYLVKNWTCFPNVVIRQAMRRAGLKKYEFSCGRQVWVTAYDDGTVKITRNYATDICSMVPNFKKAVPG